MEATTKTATPEQVAEFNRIKAQIERDNRPYQRNVKPEYHAKHRTPDEIKKMFSKDLLQAGNWIAKAYLTMSKTIYYIEEAYGTLKKGGLTLDGSYHRYMNSIDYNFKLFCSDTRSLMTKAEKDCFSEEFELIGDCIDDLFDGRIYWRPISDPPKKSCTVTVYRTNGITTDAFYDHMTGQFSKPCTHWAIPPSPPKDLPL